MNFERGFLRATIVASLLAGIVFVYLSGKPPSLESFRWRTPTDAEKAKADEWWFTREQPREQPQKQVETSQSVRNGFADIEVDTADPLVIAKLGLDDKETVLRSIHFGARLLKDYQAFMPIAFVYRYYVLPFGLSVLAIWIVYAIIRFVIVGYIGHGFRSGP